MHSGLPIVSAAEMRAAELAAVAGGTSLAALMARAGAALGAFARRIASGGPIHILCGPGNNGGDGYAAATWLAARGAQVSLSALAPPATELARDARAGWTGPVGDARTGPVPGALLVDCLFGIGLSRPLEEDSVLLLRRHAAAAGAILAADVPSGIDAGTGAMLGCPFIADHTLAFGALKPAHVLQPASSACGTVHVADIGIGVNGRARVATLPPLTPPTSLDHKYSRGLVAVVAGMMGGAAELAARGAQASGAGYVRLLGSRLPPMAPHSIVRARMDAAALSDPRIGAVVIGCGLGQDAEARARFDAAIASRHPLVIDADALQWLPAGGLGVPAILTPHAGEFGRLGVQGEGGKIDRTRAAAEHFGCVVVHKGSDTVIAAPDGRVAVAPTAPPWLATAGTGDVLAGACGAMLARGLDAFDAAQAAVLLHARAARRAGAGLTADALVDAGLWP